MDFATEAWLVEQARQTNRRELLARVGRQVLETDPESVPSDITEASEVGAWFESVDPEGFDRMLEGEI